MKNNVIFAVYKVFKGFMTKKIFISYSRKDFKKVRKIVDGLESKTGVDCWMDLEAIESDEANFVRVICRAIDHAELVLFFVSKASMRSQWTIREVDYARNTDKRVVPIIFDGTKLEGEFLFEFGRANVTDINDELQYNRLCNNIKKWSTSTKDSVVSANKDDLPQEDADGNDKLLIEVDKNKIRKWVTLGIAALALLLIIGLLAFWVANKGGNTAQFDKQEELMKFDSQRSIQDKPKTSELKTVTVDRMPISTPLNEVLGDCSYSGDVDSDSLPNDSNGVARFADGSVYIGEFIHGKLEGKATFTNGNGSNIFEGTFKNGLYSEGKLTVTSSGNYFVGTFKDGDYDQGKYYDKNGKEIEVE